MVSPRTAIQFSFALNVSLVIILLEATGNAGALQAPADAIFGSVIAGESLHVYLFGGLMFLVTYMISMWSIRGIHQHGRHEAQVEAEV